MVIVGRLASSEKGRLCGDTDLRVGAAEKKRYQQGWSITTRCKHLHECKSSEGLRASTCGNTSGTPTLVGWSEQRV
jgi:hypothetical protein